MNHYFTGLFPPNLRTFEGALVTQGTCDPALRSTRDFQAKLVELFCWFFPVVGFKGCTIKKKNETKKQPVVVFDVLCVSFCSWSSCFKLLLLGVSCFICFSKVHKEWRQGPCPWFQSVLQMLLHKPLISRLIARSEIHSC